MGIGGVWLSMSCPACVSDTYSSANVLVFDVGFKVCYLAFCFVNLQVSFFGDKCHTSTIITSVFQSLKSLDENRVSIALSNISNYTAHK